ncbi:anti-anti-sigma factor [Bacillus sp. AFS015802]|uniref:STAS domain-containing protein n=1 Tax=Bacillus sp. AFS015802 TaxID=2033486 RepID=UPI000BF87C8A|nr:STAS domain-containing protein [Bacillus sp. AFS015802]PFA67670.1 anti-anti-sigma factor [Bacillus sp. AFS015802]
MSNEYNLASSEFHSLITTSKKLFQSISKHLGVQTAYITRRGDDAMTVLSSYNEKEDIIPEGYSVAYGDTYCRLIIMNENNEMHKVNLAKDVITRELEVTSQLGVKGFLGVTLKDPTGGVFGTLCVMDKNEKVFSQEDIDYLHVMADVLSHILELDQTKFNLNYLSVPIIPITEGIACLSIQGIMDANRSEQMINKVLEHGASHGTDYFIIDLTGLLILDGKFPVAFSNLVQSLHLMGIETILTGITPTIAMHEKENDQLNHLPIVKVRNLESALKHIGFKLTETSIH